MALTRLLPPDSEGREVLQRRLMTGRGCVVGAVLLIVLSLLVSPAAAEVGVAPGSAAVEPLYLLGIPVDFILFGLTLAGVAVFHHHTLHVALAGLAAITVYKLAFTGFKFGVGFAGLALHIDHEWVILANLFLLLMGFALLSRHFEKSRIPDEMPAVLPDDWKGGLLLLVIVFVLSSFLDNIAAALIGGTMARHVFRGKVHIGYLAAIVAASNAGGSGSVIGDTTTTMMWIDGVSPLSVLEAYLAAFSAMAVFGVPAAIQQQRFSPITKHPPSGLRIEWVHAAIVALILIVAILANVIANVKYPALLDLIPVIGLSVWAVIPLTALALKQGGYDWGYLAYSVGFGGSMIWFGSSAGVALANMYPDAKSVGLWLRHGWHVTVAVLGWHPDIDHKKRANVPSAPTVIVINPA